MGETLCDSQVGNWKGHGSKVKHRRETTSRQRAPACEARVEGTSEFVQEVKQKTEDVLEGEGRPCGRENLSPGCVGVWGGGGRTHLMSLCVRGSGHLLLPLRGSKELQYSCWDSGQNWWKAWQGAWVFVHLDPVGLRRSCYSENQGFVAVAGDADQDIVEAGSCACEAGPQTALWGQVSALTHRQSSSLGGVLGQRGN